MVRRTASNAACHMSVYAQQQATLKHVLDVLVIRPLMSLRLACTEGSRHKDCGPMHPVVARTCDSAWNASSKDSHGMCSHSGQALSAACSLYAPGTPWYATLLVRLCPSVAPVCEPGYRQQI